MSQAKINQANQLRDSGKSEAAIKILKPLLKSKNYKAAVNATISLGICYSNQRKFEKAIGLFKKAILICEKNKWPSRIGSIYRDMGIATKSIGKYKEAEKLMFKSIDFMKKYYDEGQGLNASIGITYSKLGTLYQKMRKYAKAKTAFETARKMLKKGNHEYWNLMAEIDYAGFLVTQKQFKKAKEILQKAIPEAIKQEKEYFLMKSLILSGDCEKTLKNSDGAQMFYSMAKITVEKIFDSQEVREKFEKEIKKRLTKKTKNI
ncbi:MAG: tetratricopeptide repeat protein [Patescibacteria group bacterium]|nr:tetratricopeptide repeat protein [Patescibacteria group bacterium]